MYNVALVSSNYNKFIEPLGIMFLGSKLSSYGNSVTLFNGIPNDLSLFDDFDIVGFSVITGNHLRVFNVCKNIDNKKTIIGGPHATYFPKSCLEFSDVVVVGEGIKLIEKALNYNGILVPESLADVNEYGIPQRENFYDNVFISNPIRNIITSFGCPFNCSYCYNDVYKKLYDSYFVRHRNVDCVIEESNELIKNDNIKLIFFQDDCFGSKINWLKEFNEKYSKFPYHCQLRLELINDERLKLLKESGCTGVTVAIESGNINIRDKLLNRGKLSNDDIIYKCKKIKDYGLKLRTEQILGLPGCSIDDDILTLELNVSIKPDIAWSSIFVPYLGTSLGDYTKKCGLYDGNNDDLSPSFFVNSVLNYSEEHKNKIYILNKLFSVLSYIPKGNKLANDIINRHNIDFESIYCDVKNHLYDRVLYDVDCAPHI